jgi:uncharacterized spore protein YtfJ
MDFQETISKAQDAITVKRVYGEPYERDGVVVIPAAEIRGAVVAAAERMRPAAQEVVAASPSARARWAPM